jgi:sugar transferase (PEP-CTERM system associated)
MILPRAGGAAPPPRGPSAQLALGLLDAAFLGLAWPLLALAAGVTAGALAPLVLHPLAFLAFLFALGLYRSDMMRGSRRAAARIVLAALFGAALVELLLLPVTAGDGLAASRFVAAIAAGVSAAAAARIVLGALRRRGLFRRRLLIVGEGQQAAEIVLLLRREGQTLAYDIALSQDPALGAPNPALAEDPEVTRLPWSADLRDLAQRWRAEEIVVATDERRGLPMQALLDCRTVGLLVTERARFFERELGRLDMKRLDLAWLVYADGFRRSPIEVAAKRAMDITIAGALLLLTAPFLLLAAVLIRLQDGGPALYTQLRVTEGGRAFPILKLRTMTVNAERGGAAWAKAGDPRVTPLGRLLRRTRVDELPQLLNVLRGEMSFVGPRPERPEFVEHLAAELPLYRERHLMKAGLTGWAQINYPYGASLDDARSKLSYDLHYVKNFSLLLDVKIILQTLRVVLFPGGGAR